MTAVDKWYKFKEYPKRDPKPMSREERRALRMLRNEAHKAGSLLATGGRGGLSPSLVLGVMRRDKYRCKECGELGTPENSGLTVHHKSGIVESVWASKKGHKNDPGNLDSLCAKDHDRLHEEAREIGLDSSQVTPMGDKGTHRDKGLPTATPELIKKRLAAAEAD